MMLVEVSEIDGAPPHIPAPVDLMTQLEIEVLVSQRAADHHALAVPLDEALLINTCDLSKRLAEGVLLDELARVRALRWRTNRGRPSLAECFMRSYMVVVAAPCVEDSLLDDVGGGGRSGFFLERSVKCW
ncbi:MAG TPA: hypothetical protein VMZ53_05240 [Kofleriaceae bacterium]|nr:hypothetical protein [Kofleriaceae bacterium]